MTHREGTVPRTTAPRIAPPPPADPGPARARYLAPGTVVGSYAIERVLGEGGMAIVYEAAHRVLPRRVALKVTRGDALDEVARERVLREARVLADLHHRGIVEVLDAGLLADGRAWLAMRIVAGCTLTDRLLVRGTLGAGEVAELVGQLAGALATAHEAGVVHRDLKPDNILLVDDPACPVRVIDWGIAQATWTGDARLTLEGSTAGTPHYMAPEQVRGLVVDGRCDVYALGVVAYEALAGAPPFTGGTMLEIVAHHLLSQPVWVQQLAPATPAWLAALVMSMVRKEPRSRPTMGEVAAMLAGARSGEIVIELVAEMAEDEIDRELDAVIAGLPPTRRLAFGSGPRPVDGLEGVVAGEILLS